ncbi:MAG: ABC transporter permease subunit [Ardenticatenaceae bacterium]|nr:ABC transporter permease subunit [Ardenticatenaceae bacterium]HBY94604.1 ABC transporter permease [Chloroflexota bacterium]
MPGRSSQTASAVALRPVERSKSLPLRRTQRLPGWARQVLSLAAILLVLAVAWEGLKFVGGDAWRFETAVGSFTHQPPLKIKIASDLNMPHLWDIALAFVRPAVRNGPPLISVLWSAALFTFREALAGFLIGALLGLVLGVLFAHSLLLERGLVPYVVASQTVPILAIAPMVVVWLRAGWWSVAIISAYLTFFPVTINILRGLRSPDPRAVELMHSYAASTAQILWKLRLPAALPYLFTALKISATTSIVGAIIGELPSGVRGGLGGAILNFNQYYISGPAKLWATIIMASIVGIGFFILVRVAEMLALGGQRAVD